MTKGIFWQKILTYLTHKIAYVDDISLLFQFVSQEYSVTFITYSGWFGDFCECPVWNGSWPTVPPTVLPSSQPTSPMVVTSGEISIFWLSRVSERLIDFKMRFFILLNEHFEH